MQAWLNLLRGAVEREGSKAAVAARLGVSRTAVSLALSNRYPASTKKLQAKVLALFSDTVLCPILGHDLPRKQCRSTALAPMPTSSPRDFRLWSSCQTCPNKPKEPCHGQ